MVVKAVVEKTKWGWQVYAPGPRGFIPQGSPHKTKKLAVSDARSFDVHIPKDRTVCINRHRGLIRITPKQPKLRR